MGFLKMDGFDDCVVGIVSRCGMSDILCYSTTKVIEKLVQDGMSYEEAIEWFEFNQLGAYAGETTPCFLDEMTYDQALEVLG